jgi:L,D-transpeptidase catalytic domain
MTQRSNMQQHYLHTLSFLCLGLFLGMLMSACGNLPTQARAAAEKTILDRELAHAQSIGVPATMLNPIIQQEKNVSETHAPLALFSHQSANQYYANQANIYQTLTIQVRGLQYQATQQASYQASHDITAFSTILAQRRSQGFVEAKSFEPQLNQVQRVMQKARYPKDFQDVSQQSTQAASALNLLGTANDDLIALKHLITTMKSSNLDTSVLEQQANADVQHFRVAKTPFDFNSIIEQISAQITSAQAITTLAIPYVGQMKLNQFQSSINAVKRYGGDTSSYQHMYDTDKSLLDSGNYTKFSSLIDSDLSNIGTLVAKHQANHDFNLVMNEAKTWGHAHQYHDDWDGQNYDEAYEYWNGTLSNIQDDLGTAQSRNDYQTIIDEVKQQTILFHAEQADAMDHTPVDQAHRSDLNLMKTFNILSGKVIVTSLISDEARVYQNGKLIRAIPVVTGIPDKPTPPGFTQITTRQSPVTFKAFDQDKSSPFYYPDTHINYAMMYHVGEYYYHDSWWRAPDDYGLGKKFPHYAPEAFNMGTHGCINMSLDQAAWLWDFTASVDATHNPEPVYSIVY